jgi:hypothetical protein
MRIARVNQPASVSPCPPQIPHDSTWTRTRAAAVGSYRLTGLSVHSVKWCRVEVELEWVWKEAVMAHSKYCHCFGLGWLKKMTKNHHIEEPISRQRLEANISRIRVRKATYGKFLTSDWAWVIDKRTAVRSETLELNKFTFRSDTLSRFFFQQTVKCPFKIEQGIVWSVLSSLATVFTDNSISFLILLTVGRTPWTGDQPVARMLPTHRTTQTQNKRTQACMP